jgi:hypothetical protein
MKPEFIFGRDEWRAGRGNIVTGWHKTKELAYREFMFLVQIHPAECAFNVDQNPHECTCGLNQPISH